MNENQKVLKNALYEYMTEGHITHNKYREVLDVCLAALETPASESKQVDLKELQFYFVDTYSEAIKQFSNDLNRLIKSGQIIAFKKELSGLKPSAAMFDEMHDYPSGPLFTIKVKDNAKSKSLVDKLFKIWDKEKSNLAFESVLPVMGHIYPDASKFEVEPTEEAAKKILEDSGYTVIKTDELNENYVDVRQLNPGFTVREAWMLNKANEFRQNVSDLLTKYYEAGKITWDEYHEKHGLVLSWRVAMNSDHELEVNPLKEAVDKATAQLNKSLLHVSNAQYNVERADGEKTIFDPNEHTERLNEIADKLNKIYARVNVLKEPIVKDVKEKTELDDYPLTKRQLNQIEMHVENMLGKKVMDMQHRLDMNYRHNTKDIADKVKNEIAKEMKENRIKGSLK